MKELQEEKQRGVRKKKRRENWYFWGSAEEKWGKQFDKHGGLASAIRDMLRGLINQTGMSNRSGEAVCFFFQGGRKRQRPIMVAWNNRSLILHNLSPLPRPESGAGVSAVLRSGATFVVVSRRQCPNGR